MQYLPWTKPDSRLKVLSRPLIQAVEGFLEIFEGVGDAEAKVAFAEFAERCARQCGYSGLIK